MTGLYIHIPFCRGKCPYCGFYSSVDSYDLADRYFDAVIRDLRSREKKHYDTLYIGGGTPSSVPPLILSAFFDRLFSLVGGDFCESTIEANPESVTDDFLAVACDCGFSRISVGCQSTDEGTLRLLGRIHGRDQIFSAAEKIRKFMPKTDLNLDMIFDIPEGAAQSELKTLDELAALEPEHISAYSYSRDTGYLADVPQSEDSLFLTVKNRLKDRGYGKYEISNFAKNGHESLHNINYWKLGDYDGLGASAWSLLNSAGRRRLSGKPADISQYISAPEQFAEENVTTGDSLLKEDIVFGLRMLDGVDFSVLNSMYGRDRAQLIKEPVGELVDGGFLIWRGEKICLTEKGELLLDSVQEFLWSRLP